MSVAPGPKPEQIVQCPLEKAWIPLPLCLQCAFNQRGIECQGSVFPAAYCEMCLAAGAERLCEYEAFKKGLGANPARIAICCLPRCIHPSEAHACAGSRLSVSLKEKV
jgi:hypothetical protein